jgi:hypothetical protein
VGRSLLTVVLTHLDAPGVEQQLAYLRGLAPQSRFVVCHGGERSEFDRLAAESEIADAVFVADPQLRRYGDISFKEAIPAVHARWIEADPDIELVQWLEFDQLILRADFEESLAALAKRTGAGLLGKAAGPRNDTNWPHYLRYRGHEQLDRFVEAVSRRDDLGARYGSFGAGMVFTREAFDAVAAVIGDAPGMMQEALVPTLVHHLGFRVVDVNELGDLYAGIRWRPLYTLEDALEAKRAGRTFVHPFKRMDQLAELARLA